MQRLNSRVRPEWRQAVESVGLTYHTHETAAGPRPYWDESVCFAFSAAEIDTLEKAINELHALLIDVADGVVTRGAWDRLAIPDAVAPLVEASWNRDDFSLYGRFDLAWMPEAGTAPKLLEYNADTPTSLVEASVAQWYWLQSCHPTLDQFNSIHERLIESWKRFASLQPELATLDFLSVSENLEDEQTVSYLMDTAQQAGLKTRWSAMDTVGFESKTRRFVSGESEQAMEAVFKLYPWEWMFHEAFGRHLPEAPLVWIEPPWKALLSNKAILALAWEKYPRHPNLLPCFFDPAPLGRSFVKKPKLSREGANVTVVENGATVVETAGEYGEDGYVYQAIAELPVFDGKRPIFGGWVVDHEAAGLGIRESDGRVTDNVSRFIPHYFVP